MGTFIKLLPLQHNIVAGKKLLPALLAVVYLSLSVLGLRNYLDVSSVNFIIGIATMPLMLAISVRSRPGYRFAILALAFIVFGFFIPVMTALYLALCAVLLFFYENEGKRLTALPLLTLFMISPVCQYFTHIFSFPIRLWLTAVAGSILKHADESVVVAGNIISFGKSDFSVDPACMGLNMLVTSLLCGLIMLAIYQRKGAVVLGLPWVLLSLIFIFALNIVSNLIRILLLVYFKILPGNIMHDITGIICLLVYVLLPASYVLKAMVLKLGNAQAEKPEETIPARLRPIYIHILLLPLFGLLSFYIHTKSVAAPVGTLPVAVGYKISWYDKEVIKMENDQALVYIKPLKGFVYTDHNPLICWTGSGYTFRNVEEQCWNGIPLFTGLLIKGNEKLYTAWWYDNGSTTTINQWSWRWQMFRGHQSFSIINVTAASMETLKQEVDTLKSRRSMIFVR
jgi:exosortase N